MTHRHDGSCYPFSIGGTTTTIRCSISTAGRWPVGRSRAWGLRRWRCPWGRDCVAKREKEEIETSLLYNLAESDVWFVFAEDMVFVRKMERAGAEFVRDSAGRQVLPAAGQDAHDSQGA